MHSPPGNEMICRSEKFAQVVRRHFLWLLVACYVVAALWPGPGLALRGWHLSSTVFVGVRLSIPLLLLALMLFCAAILADVRQVRVVLSHPGVLAFSLVAVWLGPALLVAIAGWTVPWGVDGEATAGLLVGLVLIAAMPVANSSVGWVQHGEGNLALALALVVLSITLCPWMTPTLLDLLATGLSPRDQASCQALVREFSGAFFIVWVLLPTFAGFTTRYVLGDGPVLAARGGLSLASAASLLLLNYANSSLALPKLPQTSPRLIFVTILLAIALSGAGILSGWVMARLLRLSRETEAALLFTLSMKHTGLALILAGVVLAAQPLAILMIIVATLVQHLMAGIVQWWRVRGSTEAGGG